MATKKILGLDLGVGSVGWALIETQNDRPSRIIGMGSRIVPLTNDDSDQFQKGQAITKNADRTQRRTMRKGLDRYQLRRAYLTRVLTDNNMLPGEMNMPAVDLWQLRADAATPGHKLTLQEIGRVLYHLNQKRGYKHAKADGDSKQTAYVAEVNKRYAELQEKKQTVGQYMAEQLKASRVEGANGPYYTFRIKDRVYPRAAYIEEFDRIMAAQQPFYPDELTDALIDDLRNRIIFYQRPLRSCKHLVTLCEFERRAMTDNKGRVHYVGPKVAPRSAPLAQLCALWETVNKIKLTNRYNEEYPFTLAERKALFDFLQNNKEMKLTDLQKILGITKEDGWYGGKAIGKNIKGNQTLHAIRTALDGQYQQWLEMELPMEDGNIVDPVTGEIYPVVTEAIEQQPLQRLWHALYSISDQDELRRVLVEKFGITDDAVLDALCQIDFVKAGYANRSTKFMRKELPLLMQGYMYSDACNFIGINHSGSLTKEDEQRRPLKPFLPQLQKNELRQPIVEKILNQMVNVVNTLIRENGQIDAIRVELARELKQNPDERNKAYTAMNRNEKANSEYAAKIQEMGIRATRARIQKYKMWEESQHTCFYCGEQISLGEFLSGQEVEVEHIIPRSVLFDDSFSNKVCACRRCNQKKGNLTAMDYILTKPQEEQEAYIRRVDEAFKANQISKAKRDHLLWKLQDIPKDFIDRQLRQSQHIAKKAVEMLRDICHEVNTTGGSVTDFLRHQWGYDEVLHTLNFDKYAKAGLTEVIETKDRGSVERIQGWSKRMDHRHHAIDALTVALTRQGYIQRLNTLNASREDMYNEVTAANMVFNEKRSLLEKWVATQPHFTTAEVQEMVDSILVSFRAGKRVTTPAKRKTYANGRATVVQTGLQVPRGSLTEETVYGKRGDRYVVKYPLLHPSMKVDDIVDPTIQAIVRARLDAFGGNAKKAFATPLYSDAAQTMEIRSVRCYTALKDNSMAVVKRDKAGNAIGFAKLGNNHHIALYRTPEGRIEEQVVPFMQAVQRVQYGIPAVVDDPHAMWTALIDRDDVPDTLLQTLPHDNWTLVLTMQANEMFVLGLTDDEFNAALRDHDYRLLNKHLYRVQKLASGDYYFRHHLETTVDDKYNGERNLALSKEMKKVIWAGTGSLEKLYPHKVKLNVIGEIV